jgi:hypothetical protein
MNTSNPLVPMSVQIEPEWNFKNYPRIAAGVYPAYCRSTAIYRDPQFKRWTCLLRWDVLADDLLTVLATVPCWFSLGNGEKPKATRRCKYLREWVRANGGPPARFDRSSRSVFLRRMARVQVDDTNAKNSPIPYSVVREILCWDTGQGQGQSVDKSHSQEGSNRKLGRGTS